MGWRAERVPGLEALTPSSRPVTQLAELVLSVSDLVLSRWPVGGTPLSCSYRTGETKRLAPGGRAWHERPADGSVRRCQDPVTEEGIMRRIARVVGPLVVAVAAGGMLGFAAPGARASGCENDRCKEVCIGDACAGSCFDATNPDLGGYNCNMVGETCETSLCEPV